mgnify:CR=1 FL=1
MNYGLIHSIWTVMLLLLFIGIIVWAWSGKRKQSFEQAARMPLDDEMDSLPLIPTPSPSRGEGSEPNALRAASFTCGEKKHG